MTTRRKPTHEHSAIDRVRLLAERIARERPDLCGPEAWRRFDEADIGDGRKRAFAKLERQGR